MAGVSTKLQDQHHNLTAAVLSREETDIRKLTTTIASFTNPFTQSEDCLFNTVSGVVMPEEIKLDLCAQRTEGDKLNFSEHLSRSAFKKGEKRKSMVTVENVRASNLEKGDIENENRLQQEAFGVKGRPMFVCSSHDCVPITTRN